MSLWVPVISAGSGILGAAVSPVSASFNKARKVSLKRYDRQRGDVQVACTNLVRSAENLQVQVENNAKYHGPEMSARLERVRQLGADVNVHAATVAMLVPDEFADPAAELMGAAGRVVVATAANTDLNLGVCVREPDLTELSACLGDFRKRAVEYFRD